MITLRVAIKLATKAHKDQWRKPSIIKTDSWDCYKQNQDLLHENGNKIVWCNGDTFLVYEPYINHPLAVMEMMNTEEEKIVAILHDVFEDCQGYGLGRVMDNSSFWISTPDDKISISFKLYCALALLTYEKPTSYLKHIEDMTEGIVIYDITNKEAGKLATKVKIADITCNLLGTPSDHARQKYLKAMPILLKGL